jgi:hypothetical protein
MNDLMAAYTRIVRAIGSYDLSESETACNELYNVESLNIRRRGS